MVNLTDFSQAQLLDAPGKNIFENVLKGYQVAEAPRQMAREANARELANKFKQMELEHRPKEYELNDKSKQYEIALKDLALKHKPKEYQLSDALRTAQINKANAPSQIGGALDRAMRVRSQYPEGSKEWHEADNYIKNLGQKKGINVTTSPDGATQVSIGGDGNQDSGTFIQGVNLKRGEVPLYDDKKQLIGVGKPPTAAEAKEDYGTGFFNHVQPFLNNSLARYSGRGANELYMQDIQNYETNPEAKKHIDDYYTAIKLLAPAVVKENMSIGGPSTDTAIKNIQATLNNSEVYNLIKKGGEFILPQGYAQASGKQFNKIMNEARHAGRNESLAFRPHYFNKTKDDQAGSSQSSMTMAPKIPASVKTKEEFQQWVRTLSPEQQMALKNHHTGGG